MDRRTFLRTGSAALGGTLVGPPVASHALSVTRAERAETSLGVQLWSTRDVLPNDMVGVLESIARMGYGVVEPAGADRFHGRTPQAARALLDALGLAAPAAHVPLGQLRADPGPAFDEADALGYRTIVVPGFPADEREVADGYRRLSDELNGYGRLAGDRGLRIGYHNHPWELVPVPDGTGTARGYDLLLDGTDPDLVVFEMDVFWVVVGGADPLEYFVRYPGRFPLWHVKDGRPIRSDEDGTVPGQKHGYVQTDVGGGTLDWRPIFAAADEAGLTHAFVEHDGPSDPLGFAERSLRYVRQAGG